MNKRFLRRRFLVDRKLQGSICAHGLLYGGLVLVAVGCGIFAPLLWDLSGGGAFVGYEDQAIVMIYMHDRFWSLAALCFLVIGLGSLKFSHRIAGPLVRYKRNLRLIAQGKLPPPLRTRPDDYLKEEVVCLNDAVAGVRQRLDAIREAQVAVMREIQAVVARSPRQASAVLEPLVAAGQQLERSISAFEDHDTRDDRIATEPVPGQTMFAFAVPGGGS